MNDERLVEKHSDESAAKSTFMFQSRRISRGYTPAVVHRLLYALLPSQHTTCDENQQLATAIETSVEDLKILQGCIVRRIQWIVSYVHLLSRGGTEQLLGSYS